MTLDTPSAVAASICWMGRWRGNGEKFARVALERHPNPCGWCDYTPAQLIEWIEDYNEEDLMAGGRVLGSDGQPQHRLAGNFRRLSSSEQRALVDRAMYPEAA